LFWKSDVCFRQRVPKQSEWVLFAVFLLCLIFSLKLIILLPVPLKVLQTADIAQQQQRRSGFASISTPRGSSTGTSTPSSSLSTSSSRNSSHSSHSSRRSLVEMARPTQRSQAASATEFQEGLEAVEAAKNADKAAKITNKQLENLMKCAAEAKRLQKDLAIEQTKSAGYEKIIDELKAQHEKDSRTLGVLNNTLGQRDLTIREQKVTITNLQGALNKNGNVHESQLNRDLKDQTKYAAKIFLFRNVKFFEDDQDAEDKTKMVVPYLPKGMESLGDLSVDEYAHMYKQVANEGIQAAKQSVQAEGKKAAKGTFISMFCLTCLVNLRSFLISLTIYFIVLHANFFCILPKSLVEKIQSFANSPRYSGCPHYVGRCTQPTQVQDREGALPLVL
jgi:hypothetical protein